mmetsp:Transcript_42208/g.92007  ORF Transcript_42208/g.92007 Transcript_42208/m.92007 type:complete len:213 (-) Transcript_42208:716-1354(-)
MAREVNRLGLAGRHQRHLFHPLRFLGDVGLRPQPLAPPPRSKIVPVPKSHQQNHPIPGGRRARDHPVQSVSREEQAPTVAWVAQPSLVSKAAVDILIQHQGWPSPGRGEIDYGAYSWVQHSPLGLQRPFLHVKMQLVTHIRRPVSSVHPPLCSHNLSVDRKIGNQAMLNQPLNCIGRSLLHIIEEGEILSGVVVGLRPVRGPRPKSMQDCLS